MSTYSPIASQTLGSAATSVTFSSIPQGYTDLVLVANFATSTSDYAQIILNSDTTVSNYSGTYLLGSGTSAASGRYTGANGAYWLGGSTQTATTVGNGIAKYIFQNYSNSTTFKTVLQRADTASAATGSMVGLWRNTAPITSITFQIVNGQTINSGSTFSIYGIAGGDVTAKAAGGIVTTGGGYTYHTFTTSGAFTPYTNLTVDYLVVAGGGGGGGDSAGGGGAGGLRCTVGATGGGGSLESALSVTANYAYPVVVGAGGSGGPYSPATFGSNGSSSFFHTISTVGGGGGGKYYNSGLNGGSGGGAGGGAPASVGGTGTTNQGYAGGLLTYQANNAAAAGGGGAGGAGGNNSNGGTGAGGAGVTTSISGSSTSYAGGGGGGANTNSGTGGTATAGGGAGGGLNASGSNATANTGGGGGGCGTGAVTGGNGGSGIVIIRYAS